MREPADDEAPPSLFTRIIRGELPGRHVWRDDRTAAFLTIAPIRPGHTLVVPIHAVDRWTDLDGDELTSLMTVSQRIARVIEAVFDCERVGMIIAGLEVPHCHVHLIPIRSESDLSFALADHAAGAADLDAAAEQIRGGLRQAGWDDAVDAAESGAR